MRRGHSTRLPTATAAILAAVAILISSPAFAHDDAGIAGGFASGFMHPLLGWDHIAAMVAVGIWGAFLGAPAIWVLPVVFPMVMAFGGALGILGMPLPGVEVGIALSAIVLGLMVALAARPPIWVAALFVGAFAIFHGHAHGTELPAAADGVAFAGGFVLATGLLHLSGIALGLLTKWDIGRLAIRTLGGGIAAAGVAFLAGVA
ncbi:HupE/UreJ family protein [Rhizobium aouanii]|uniref:HupE/UreJ family protein n=1 Tax=Rhizobium aouanii TaxID=3118145 RepID=A0ABU8CW58_9HYPH